MQRDFTQLQAHQSLKYCQLNPNSLHPQVRNKRCSGSSQNATLVQVHRPILHGTKILTNFLKNSPCRCCAPILPLSTSLCSAFLSHHWKYNRKLLSQGPVKYLLGWFLFVIFFFFIINICTGKIHDHFLTSIPKCFLPHFKSAYWIHVM